MNPSRRHLIVGVNSALVAGFGLLPGFGRYALAQVSNAAPSSTPLVVTVVEMANFHCSRCYAVNDHFERIRQAADAAEIDIVFAPAAWEGQTLWPNRVYYAMRDLFVLTEPLMRNTLFYGLHEEGQLFETLSQVRQYFDRKGVLSKAQELDPRFDWDLAAQRAESDEPLYSEIKAGRLIDLSGIEEVPSFLWLGNARIADTVTPSVGDARQIVAAVIRKLGSQVRK